MNPCSFTFLLLVGIFSVLYHVCPRTASRRFVLTSINLAFLASVVHNFASGVWLAAFVLGTYAALRLLRAFPSGRLLALVVFGIVVAFALLKKYEWLTLLIDALVEPDAFLNGVEVVGISYMLFKAIHMAIDQWEGQLAPYGLFGYLTYQMSFFTLLAGPIQRYNDFQAWWKDDGVAARDVPDIVTSWYRILLGTVQMAILAAIFLSTVENCSEGQVAGYGYLLPQVAWRFYVYPLYLYFNFMGYTNIAVGSAGVFGLRLPENFNHPFIARNMIDFWNRWHMSLTTWIRDYVFMKSYKNVAERFPAHARQLGPLLLFLAMFLAGVWHGTTMAFVVFGAIHGLGVATTQLYGDLLRRWLGAAGLRRYLQNTPIRAAATIVTVHYFAFSLLFFSSSISEVMDTLTIVWREVLSSAGVAAATTLVFTWLGVLAVAWLIVTYVMWRQDDIAALVRGLVARFPRVTSLRYATLFAGTMMIAVAVLTMVALQQKEQVLVYIKF